jgi:hypothetical protein
VFESIIQILVFITPEQQ